MDLIQNIAIAIIVGYAVHLLSEIRNECKQINKQLTELTGVLSYADDE